MRTFLEYVQAGNYKKTPESLHTYRLQEAGKNWMQGAVKRPGALSKRLGIPEDEDIPLSTINKHIETLRNKAEGDKKLSKDDALFLDQLQFAKTAKTKTRKK